MCWRKREWYRNIKDRGALWVSMSERGDDGVGVLKASSTAVCCRAQPPLTVQYTHSKHYSYSCVYRTRVFYVIVVMRLIAPTRRMKNTIPVLRAHHSN